MADPLYSSLWDGLSPHLLATFYEVKRDGNGQWGRSEESDPTIVIAPLIEANMELTMGWQSPFEGSDMDGKAPTLMAMLQSGELQAVIGASGAESDSGQINQTLNQFIGRSGITKLNSTQTFSGMAPVRMQVTAQLRAWRDPVSEVENPFNKLMEWALPVDIAEDGPVLARILETGYNAITSGDADAITALMPSQSPTHIAMHYKGRTYKPLVIESIGHPISSPVNKDGKFIELAVPMTLATLTAIDRQDWVDTVSR